MTAYFAGPRLACFLMCVFILGGCDAKRSGSFYKNNKSDAGDDRYGLVLNAAVPGLNCNIHAMGFTRYYSALIALRAARRYYGTADIIELRDERGVHHVVSGGGISLGPNGAIVELVGAGKSKSFFSAINGTYALRDSEELRSLGVEPSR